MSGRRGAEAFLPRGDTFQRAIATICIALLRQNQPPAAPLRSSRPCPTVCEKSGLGVARMPVSTLVEISVVAVK